MNDPLSRTNFLYVPGALLIAVSLAIQVSWFPTPTGDYTYAIKNWFGILQTSPGLSAFSQPFSDYAPLYLYLLKLLSLLPFDSLYSIKALSLLANIAIAALAALIARDLSGRCNRGQIFLVFSLFMCVPTMAINTSLWGQVDALYAAPVIASFYFILRDRPFLASVLFGVAISIKLQSIFFLPVLAGYLFRKRETAAYILVPPMIFFLTVLPTAFEGRFLYWFLIYARQVGEFTELSLSAPSAFAFVNNLSLARPQQDVLFWAGIVLAAACGIGIANLVQRTSRLKAATIALLGLLCVLVVPYFLPRMHERYFFLADMFACLYLIFEPRRWYLATTVVFASLVSYMPYLFGSGLFLSVPHLDLRIPAALLLVTLCILLSDLQRVLRDPARIAPTGMADGACVSDKNRLEIAD